MKKSIVLFYIVILLVTVITIINMINDSQQKYFIKDKYKKSVNTILKNIGQKDNNKKTLIIRLSTYSCSYCINNQIRIINKLWLKKQIKMPFIWVITASNIREFDFIVKKTNTLNNHIFVLPGNIFSNIKIHNKPFYMILDKKLHILSTFIPDNNNINGTMEYLKLNE